MKLIMENFRKFTDVIESADGSPKLKGDVLTGGESEQAVATIMYFLGYVEKLQKEIELYGRDSASERRATFPQGMHELHKILKSVAYNIRTFHYDFLPFVEKESTHEFKELGSLDAEDKVGNDVFRALLDVERMFLRDGVHETGMNVDFSVGSLKFEMATMDDGSPRFQRYEEKSHENTKGKVIEISELVEYDNETQLALDDFMLDIQRRYRRS